MFSCCTVNERVSDSGCCPFLGPGARSFVFPLEDPVHTSFLVFIALCYFYLKMCLYVGSELL